MDATRSKRWTMSSSSPTKAMLDQELSVRVNCQAPGTSVRPLVFIYALYYLSLKAIRGVIRPCTLIGTSNEDIGSPFLLRHMPYVQHKILAAA
nr:hypothetical protein CFP56_10184 [Quercus suber]